MTRSTLLGTTKIKDMPFQIIDGDRGANYPKGHEFSDSGHCLFLSAKNVTKDGFEFSQKQFIAKEKDELLRKGKLERDDVVLTTRGTVGNIALYDKSILFNNVRINSGMIIIRCDQEKILPKYLYFVLKSGLFQDQVENFRSGSAQPQLPIRDMQNMKLPLPSLEEQKDVINQIGTIDEKIGLNQKMNETLEQMGQALFHHYFITNPEAEKWARGILSDIITLNPRESISKNTAATYLEMKNMPETGMSIKTTEIRNFTSGMKFRNGDTLLARITPCLENGKTAFVDFLGEDAVGFGSTEYIVMRPNRAALTEYTYFLARSNVFRAYAIQSMIGTSGRQRVQYDSIASYEISIPDTQLVGKFHESMKESFAQIRNNARQIQTLTALRDTLLPRLINGKVKI